MNDEWYETDDGDEYRVIGNNGEWQIIKFRGDGAFYSWCPHCGYTHACYKDVRNPVTQEWEGIDYAPEKEFNYCPMCGKDMRDECKGDYLYD